MKDSGVVWLGEIPRHWEIRRLKTLCVRSALYGANVTAGSYSVSGVRFIRTTDITEEGELKDGGVFVPKPLISDYLLADGDVLISRSGTVGRSFLYRPGKDGPCAYAGYLVRFVLAPETLSRYVFLFTKTSSFEGFLRLVAISSTIDNVNGQKYANAPLPLPPRTEQTTIVRFLDHADRRIQRYIRAKEKLIALLEEQKQAIVHQAVTGQIDVRTGQPYPAYKDSGVEWLGEVPEHWEVRRLKYLTHGITVGIVVTPSKYYVDQGVPCLRSLNVSGGVVDMEGLVFISESANELHRKSKIFRGDVVVVRTGQAGTAAVVPEELDGANCIDLLIVRRSEQLLSRWVYYYLNSRTAMSQATTKSVGAIQAHYNTSTLAQLAFPKVPRDEQGRIVSFLDKAIGETDHLVALAKQAIDRFEEYRTALISTIVTGKLDVREAAAVLPNVPAA